MIAYVAGGAGRLALGTAVFGSIIAATFLAMLFVLEFFYVIQMVSEKLSGRKKK